jgi:hypothetical protein
MTPCRRTHARAVPAAWLTIVALAAVESVRIYLELVPHHLAIGHLVDHPGTVAGAAWPRTTARDRWRDKVDHREGPRMTSRTAARVRYACAQREATCKMVKISGF